MFDSIFDLPNKTFDTKPFNLKTKRGKVARIVGFFSELQSVPIEIPPYEAERQFFFNKDILVLPKSTDMNVPSPLELLEPDGLYSNFVFKSNTWAQRVLPAEKFSHYSKKLSPSERQRYTLPLTIYVYPWVVGCSQKLRPQWFNNKFAHKYVRTFYFGTPKIAVASGKAPTTADGPYQLHQHRDGSFVYLAYTKSMSKEQKQEFDDLREITAIDEALV